MASAQKCDRLDWCDSVDEVEGERDFERRHDLFEVSPHSRAPQNYGEQ